MHLLIKNTFAKTFLAGAALSGFMLFTTPSVRADEHECQEHISKADRKLHEAIEKHGYRSRQAEHERRELREARERCWNTNHRWWDEDERRWRSDRDWRDDDHERYEHERPPR
jgi:hypothetical protein